MFLINYKGIVIADPESRSRQLHVELADYKQRFKADMERGLTDDEQIARHQEIARRNMELRKFNEARDAFEDAERILGRNIDEDQADHADFDERLIDLQRLLCLRLAKVKCMRAYNFPEYAKNYFDQAQRSIDAMCALKHDPSLSLTDRDLAHLDAIVTLSRIKLKNESAMTAYFTINKSSEQAKRREGFTALSHQYDQLVKDCLSKLDSNRAIAHQQSPLSDSDQASFRSLLSTLRANKQIIDDDLAHESLFFAEPATG
jgi:hypothetical protein